MLSNSPGNVGLEASPFKFPLEYLEVLGGLESEAYQDFKRLFREGFEAARKHCDSIVGESAFLIHFCANVLMYFLQLWLN